MKLYQKQGLLSKLRAKLTGDVEFVLEAEDEEAALLSEQAAAVGLTYQQYAQHLVTDMVVRMILEGEAENGN